VNVDLLWSREFLRACAVDLHGDSVDDLLTMVDDSYVVVYDQQFHVVSRSWTFEHRTFARHSGAGAKDASTAWVWYSRNDSAYLYDLLGRREMYVAHGVSRAPPDGWDGTIAQVAVTDLNADGRLEAVVSVVTGFDLKPRGVLALDWQTGKRLWFYPMAPSPSRFHLQDIDGDGRLEILLGSVAQGNRNTEGETGDWQTFVVCLNHDGTLRWRVPVGDYGQQAFVEPFGQVHARPRLLVCEVGTAIRGAQPDSIFVLDATSGRHLDSAQYGELNQCFAVATEHDGSMRVVVAGSDSSLRVLDEELHAVRRIELKGGCTWMCADHFTGAREPEVAVLTTDGELRLYGMNLTLLAVQKGVLRPPVPVRHKEKVRLLMAYQFGELPTWGFYQFRWLTLIERARALLAEEYPVEGGLLLAAAVFVFVAFGSVVFYFRYRRVQEVRAAIRGLTGQAGVVELNNRGEVAHCNHRAREMLTSGGQPGIRKGERLRGEGVLSALAYIVKAALGDSVGSLPSEATVVLGPGQMVVARARRLRFGALLTLEDMTASEYVERMTSWGSMAQRLAHGIKNPLTAMSLTLQRLDEHSSPEAALHLASMGADIERLRQMADGFMRFTKLEPPKLEPTDFNVLVRECVGKFDSARPPGINIEYELAEDLPRVRLDKEQMTSACANIVENAAAAMGDRGTLTVSTGLEGNRVVVRVRDTGKGIPERYLSKVFEPYFTLKPGGTGLGMCITKKIVEDHKGTISIESKEGVGTTVTITLPVA
jgi:signal transduction histidine kinase